MIFIKRILIKKKNVYDRFKRHCLVKMMTFFKDHQNYHRKLKEKSGSVNCKGLVVEKIQNNVYYRWSVGTLTRNLGINETYKFGTTNIIFKQLY